MKHTFTREQIKRIIIEELEKSKVADAAEEIVDELELPPVKIHCSVLAEDAIKAAITDLKNKSN